MCVEHPQLQLLYISWIESYITASPFFRHVLKGQEEEEDDTSTFQHTEIPPSHVPACWV